MQFQKNASLGQKKNKKKFIYADLPKGHDYLYLYNKTLVKNIENKLSQCMVAEGTHIIFTQGVALNAVELRIGVPNHM